ncbi:DUF1350 family protein [Oscillatoria sp. FACHB-1406]|uniref:DUF1350 family protein n=1 Tax=Oscillatoria sp. FACHB-1406 TaxID=2692846 RepID=UPI0016882746|nr:DUF1350 family protein [Oscillatoria sp. FACHB-1406]
MDWQEISGGWVMVPRYPIGIIHFLGGAFVATAPHLTYRCLLEQLAKAGYAVVATPFLNTLDHAAIAREVLNRFETICDRLYARDAFRGRYLPIYGIGHSLGCKLHLLIGSIHEVQRAGNISIAYNNYPVSRAIPFADQLLSISPAFNVEFTPSPVETNALVAQEYCVRRNLLIQFTNDTIDQTADLNRVLRSRFPTLTAVQTLPGNHLTPLSQQLEWQTGEVFTPFDAIGQWLKQETSRDLNRLHQEIKRWLNPVGAR